MSDTTPPPAATQVIERRRSIRILAIVMGCLLLAMVPALLLLPLVSRHARNIGTLAVALVTAGVLAVAGCWLIVASKPGWLTLTLDETGFTFRRGRMMRRYAWTDVSGVQVTRRKNGRTQVPTVLVSMGVKAALYLDDVYTLRPDDLASLIQRHCTGAGNPWPALPSPATRMPKFRRRWMGWLALPILAIALAAAALSRVLFTSH